MLGPSVTLPGANEAYFRVVAVDGRERRSGASDYAGDPRPVIYSTPPATAAVGEPSATRCRRPAPWGTSGCDW